MKRVVKKGLSRFEKKCELEDRTCDALVLAFRKPFRRDYYIPGTSYVTKSVDYALRNICGKKEGNLGCNDGISWGVIDDLSKISPRIVEGITHSCDSSREESSKLRYYLNTCDNPILEHEWFWMFGDWYRFRKGERKKAQERVKAFWNEKELFDFGKLSKFMREYINPVFERRGDS